MARVAVPIEEILVEHSTYQSNKLRKRLLKEGLKQHRCEECLYAQHNGLPIPLELDHINGINDDHRLENLRLICPNCHAQSDYYRGKNWGKASRKHYYAGVSKLV